LQKTQACDIILSAMRFQRLSSLVCLVLVLAGCSTVKPRPAVNWTLLPELSGKIIGAARQLGEARLAIVTVRAPYDTKNLAVLRPDGSLAFDPYNQFATVPSAIIKGVALDVLRASGAFKGVQPGVTTANVEDVLELVVEELALDCRAPGERKALVKLTLAHIRDRRVVICGHGSASVDARSGNYSAAFGSAFETALIQTLSPMLK